MADDDVRVTQTDRADELPDGAVVSREHQEWMQHVRERHQILQTLWGEIHAQALKDDRFVAGKQWDERIMQERIDDGRPVLTYNLLPSFVSQITNQVRQSWPQIRVRPVDGDAPKRVQNVQGTQDYSLADVYMGIIRNIEHVSKADQAYDTSVEHSASHGFGFFRVVNQYPRDDSFEQELLIKRIRNSYSVLMDIGEEADFSDAQDAFISIRMQRAVFQRRWSGVSINPINSSTGDLYDGWYDNNEVRVSEYYWIDYPDDEVMLLSNGYTVYKSEAQAVLDDIERNTGVYVRQSRKVKRPVCMWQKCTADQVLEKRELPFKSIPIMAVVGREQLVDGKTEYHSAIRHALDPQSSFNYWKTAATETVALAPRAPWLLTQEQLEGHEQEWDQANRRNLPYLAYNFVEGVPMPQRTMAKDIAAAELMQASNEQEVMRDIVGLHEASMGRGEKDRSGRAINALNARGDLATFAFPDNLSRAVQYMGRCLVDAIPRIYDSERIARIRMPDDTEDFVKINASVVDEETGKKVIVHDLGYGRYDVVIDTGPSYATQRQEAQDQILETMKTLPPDQAGMVSHLLVKNMDYPGAEDVADLLRRMLPDNLKSDEDRERDLPDGYVMGEDGQPVHEETGEPLPPPEPTPAERAAMAESEAKMAKAEADKATAQAKMETAKVSMAEAQVRMQELQSGPQNAEADEKRQADLMQKVQEAVQQIADQLKAHQEDESAHKAATMEMISDAVVDALKRVRAVVDERDRRILAQIKQPSKGEPNGDTA